MRMDLARRYAAPVPRYTSYPSALSFSADVGAETFGCWLAQITADEALSLYVHIPFCKSICWYCGCHAKAVRRPEPLERYLTVLEAEAVLVAAHLAGDCIVRSLHWGGGSPNSLKSTDITRLVGALKQSFRINEKTSFAVEIDPRFVAEDQVAAFAAAGVNRVSLGVQDFDCNVQAAIGRKQSFEATRTAAALFRQHGIHSLNIDLVYGLPKQTRESAARTIESVLALEPDRIALYGYAHMPAKIRRQRLIDDTELPDTEKRFALFNRMASRLITAGYVRVGLDHFARPSDPLANGPVFRNFQGYTSNTVTNLIGLGASAISKLPAGYAQNAVPVSEHERLIMAGKLATARGYELTIEDHARALVIERLMCDLEFPDGELHSRYGAAAQPILTEANELVQADMDDLIEQNGSGFRVTEKGRPFLRAICSCFDAHLNLAQGTYSKGV